MIFNRTISFVILITIGIFIAFKIVVVPITHDEVSTIITASNSSLIEIMFYYNPSPNNHILNTILTKMSMFFLGQGHFAVRLPNFIAFLIYGIAAFRVAKAILGEKSRFFIPALLFFATNLYFLDFFGLARGYGLASSFCLLSVAYILSAYKFSKNKHVYISLLFAGLAVYASFTLLAFFVVLFVLCCFYFLLQGFKNKSQRLRPILFLILSLLVFSALITPPIVRMGSTNQFQYWYSSDFFNATIKRLVIHSIYDSKVLFFQVRNFILTMIFLTITINLVFIIKKFIDGKRKIISLNNPVFLTGFILVGTAVVDVFQTLILSTPSLEGRTALFYFPLFIASLVATSSLFKALLNKYIAVVFSAIISLICILQIVLNSKPYSVREWNYDANTTAVIDFVNERGKVGNDKIDCHWMLHPSFFYYSQIRPSLDLKLGLYNKQINNQSDARYYYVFKENYSMLHTKYRPVLKFENDCWLLEKTN